MSRTIRTILAGCFLLLAVIWILSELGSSASNVPYVIISLVIVGVVLIAFIKAAGEKERKEQVIHGRISELQKSFALHSEQTSALSSKDLSSLRVYKLIILSVVGSIGLIFIAVISIMSIETLTKSVAAGGTGLVLLAILLAINKRMNLVFESEGKTIVRGVVTKKYTGVDEDNDKAYQWLHIGERKVKVELQLYVTYDIGDAVEFHLYDRFGTVILHHEKLEGAGIEAE